MAAGDSLPSSPGPSLASVIYQSFPDGMDNQGYTSGANDIWSLLPDLDTGIPLVETERSVFAPGRVVGISGLLPSTSTHYERKDADAAAVRNCVVDFATYILYTFLTRPHLPPFPLDPNTALGQVPQVLIVQFYGGRTLDTDGVSRFVRNKLPDCPDNSIREILRNIKILHPFNFDDILDAVNHISNSLYDLSKNQSPCPPSLLLIEGLDESISEFQRTSGNLAVQARILPLLQTLTTLSRIHASYLTVIVVNLTLLPNTTTAILVPTSTDVEQAREATPSGPEIHEPDSEHYYQSTDYQFLQSVFSAGPPPTCSPLSPAQPTQATQGITESSAASQKPYSYASSYLISVPCALDRGFDTHILISQRDDSMVVEVIKDRVGQDLGKWSTM